MKSNIVIKDEISRLAHYTPLRASSDLQVYSSCYLWVSRTRTKNYIHAGTKRHSLIEKLKNIDI